MVGVSADGCVVLPDPAAREQPVAMDGSRLAWSMARRSRWLAGEPGIIGAAARMLVERTLDVRFTPTEVLDLGCRSGLLPSLVQERWPQIPVVSLLPPGGVGGLPAMAGHHQLRTTADLLHLPFAKGAFSLVLSNLAMHWSGHLLLGLREVRRVMKADALLLCTVPGDDNLFELREALETVDISRFGQPVARVVHGYSIHRFGDALQAAGFVFPVADRERAILTFPDLAALLRQLRRMGAVNPFPPAPTMDREYLRQVEEVYRQRFSQDGRLVLTVDILFGHGWKQPINHQRS